MTYSGFLSALCPRGGGGQNESVWIIGGGGGGGGKYVFVCKACSKQGGSRGMLPQETLILDRLLDAFSHKHNLPFILSSKPLYY